ncbi:ligase-associated DNA damage response DEXH box helicase [Alteromonas sp. ASW11-130]|uniref:ligase-associated DNA damage response DEXH box helicase n=1 Tax=Alteromonas sp. ASW11-130 TaxID=3015775 RepID=UPI00224292E2|nr:ligase-associated DNA damage response DEXH box helicase [Alteromonas sp. ASW11-130]MCW8090751.1 ligase-associated DNA damage response DEXH box helicase [Alteromonas sp. ASW11-130]
MRKPILPKKFADWFARKGWKLRDYQLEMLQSSWKKQSTLLVAPTGAGKTLSGFLPSLLELDSQPRKGLHTLYISPLKALTQDIHRNLLEPIEQMELQISAETRTGDTPSHKRQRQRKNPPNILLTTPESFMLMLSYADASTLFARVERIIIDEVHSVVANKRGDFTALALSRLSVLAPNVKRIGLSATIAEPHTIASWLGRSGEPAEIINVPSPVKPKVSILTSSNRMPFGGYMAKYAMGDIYSAIEQSKTCLVFVNTRAQAELIFQMLWEENKLGLPIALYHGSLSKEQRRKTEALMAAGQLRAIVSTSALELGIDWGDVDLVIQVGAPKGVSRLMQRIGRANHRLNEPSIALLVPANRFEVLECQAAIDAIDAGQLDGDAPQPGAMDILPQFILNCACHEPIDPKEIYQQITNAAPYQAVSWEEFQKLLSFTRDGGSALRAYERYQRLVPNDEGKLVPANKRVMQRHRQNIGTIVEAGRLKVKRLRRGNQGTIIGEVEEYFAQQLTPGDTFIFAGEVLQYEAIRDMQLHARPAKGKDPKIPSYVGGQMPMSTFLADNVKRLLHNKKEWKKLPVQVTEWLHLQAGFSQIPTPETVLVEQFPFRKTFYTLFYTFEGRKANQTLGMLLTRRMERLRLKPLSFSVTDYGLSISAIKQISAEQLSALFQPDILGDELEDWMLQAPMLKRSFRQVAVVSGLTEQRYHSSQKTMKQVTFSTDLIYDTLREYDPDHILLSVARADAERELLDLRRLADMLIRYVGKTKLINLPKVSPMAIPIVLDVRSEQIKGAGTHALLEQADLYAEAEAMMEDVRELLGGSIS